LYADISGLRAVSREHQLCSVVVLTSVQEVERHGRSHLPSEVCETLLKQHARCLDAGLKDVNIVIVRNLDFDLLIGPALSSGND
jgi:hypothetical protein